MHSLLFVVNDTDTGYLYILQSEISPVLLLFNMSFYMSLIRVLNLCTCVFFNYSGMLWVGVVKHSVDCLTLKVNGMEEKEEKIHV